MACTFASSLTDSCKCLGTTEVCGEGEYCYNGQCTAENKCGDGLCETECMCGGDGKIAVKCLGDNKYCKNDKVMTLCTADSLAADECACTLGDDGICMGRCAAGYCYGNACRFEDNSESSCVCAPEGKKVGVYKKTWSTVCRSTGTLEATPGGCGGSMTIDQVCKCGNEEDDCASGSVCNGSSCYSRKCAEGKCSCVCAGDSKNAEYCYDASMNQCKGGKVVPLPGKLVCTAEHDLNSYCQCSTEMTTLCASAGLCVDGDCYDSYEIAGCPKDVPATAACLCKQTKKMLTIAKTGDICNSDGTVTKMCTNGVPSQIDACFCGSKDGPECKKGDVCIGGECYGEADNATAKYCTDSNVCTAACACTDFSFSEAELCFGPFQKCENNTVVTLECTDEAKKADACKCSALTETACPSGSVCSSQVCYGPGEDKGICESDGFCQTACACIANSHTGKAATLCDGEKQYCDAGVIKNVCTDKSINDKSCECTKGDATACAEDNVCIDEKCYGSGSDLEGAFCTDGQMCGTKCACKAAGGKTAAVCDGSSKFCVSGEVRDLCADKTVNGSSCYCKSGDATSCAASNVCLDSQCFGTGAPSGDFCSATAACGAGCACKSEDGKTAEKCSGQNYYCVDGAVVLKCSAGQGKEDNECRACDTGCLECAEKRSICTRCADKFKLEGGKCEKSGLGAGAIVGIVIAVVVVLAAIIIGVFFFLKHRKQEEKKVDYQEKEEDQVQVAAE